MPLHPVRQTKLETIARGLIEILDRGGPSASERSRPAILQIEQHVLGLVGAIKQVDPGMENKIYEYLATRFDQAKTTNNASKAKAKTKKKIKL